MKKEIYNNLIVLSITAIGFYTSGVNFALADYSFIMSNISISSNSSGNQVSNGEDGKDGEPGRNGLPGKDGQSVVSTGRSGASVNITNIKSNSNYTESTVNDKSSQGSYVSGLRPEMTHFTTDVIKTEKKPALQVPDEVKSIKANPADNEVLSANTLHLTNSKGSPLQFNHLFWKLSLFTADPVYLFDTAHLPNNTKLYCGD